MTKKPHRQETSSKVTLLEVKVVHARFFSDIGPAIDGDGELVFIDGSKQSEQRAGEDQAPIVALHSRGSRTERGRSLDRSHSACPSHQHLHLPRTENARCESLGYIMEVFVAGCMNFSFTSCFNINGSR